MIIKSQSDPEEKEVKDTAVVDDDLDDKKEEEKSSKESLTPSKKNKNKKPKKRSMRKNPSHKSREVVTDSDTDSESEDTSKSKPITPSRRKTTDSDRPAPSSLKRLKQMESDDETSPKKRVKRRKDDDTSLMCEETIPRSPQPQGSSESTTSATNPDQRGASCLEMPFATVPQSVGQPRGGGGPVAGVQALDCSPPATPESSNSGEAPLTIDSSRMKEDGSKSTAESSEVDLESLSGQGKAGSEDSR